MEISEKEIKALHNLRISDLYYADSIVDEILSYEKDKRYILSYLYHIGKIHGIRQERARRRKNPLLLTKVKQGKTNNHIIDILAERN